jgi:DNA-directed RNA polymerase specialized sigma24 family protein
MLVAFIKNRGVPHEDAKDIAADTIEAAIKKFDPARARLETFLFFVAENRIRDHFRKLAVRARKLEAHGGFLVEGDADYSTDDFEGREVAEQRTTEVYRKVADDPELTILVRTIHADPSAKASVWAATMGAPVEGVYNLLKKLRKTLGKRK